MADELKHVLSYYKEEKHKVSTVIWLWKLFETDKIVSLVPLDEDFVSTFIVDAVL